MIQVNQLNLQYGKKHLFKDVSVRLNPLDRVGLVGVNGTGKSTLLKMMVGDIETDFGVITTAKQATIGYLPQEISSFPMGRSLFEEAQSAFDHLLSLKIKLDQINHQLSEADPESSFFANLMKQQGELQQQLDGSDFFQIEAKIEKILTGLGFSQADMSKDCNEFSGGWQMRIMLAKLLLMHPSFLFLDEPTNHLDIESLTWLEEFLQNYTGALVIISHDRAFLDNLTNMTWELSLGNLTVYKGNYSKYVEDKEIRLQVHRAAYNNQQAKIQQTMRFVTRFRAKSTKAKQVQSKLKQLSKMEMIELEDTEKKITFRFPPSAPSGRLAVEAKDVTKSYDDVQVFNGIDLEVNRGDKIAIVGVNGAGKSTLVKILANVIGSDSGEVKNGHNVKTTYFGQHQAKDLSPELSVLQTMETSVTDEKTTTQLRSLLGAFLFSGDDVDKKVMVLSGGEKSRLALAKMIAKPANLMIMDEPTNHLDMMSQEVLQEALSQYDGSIVIVSHNRYFVDSFVNKVLEIKDGKATMYEGNVSYYLEKIKKERELAAATTQQQSHNQPAPDRNGANKSGRQSGKEARKIKAKLRQEKSKKLGPIKSKIAKLEKDIEVLEDKKAELESALADPELYQDQDAFAEKSSDFKKTDQRLDRLYRQWEELQADLEELEIEFQDFT